MPCPYITIDMIHKNNRTLHHRRSIRLKEYDYTLPGAYFITLCTKDHVCRLGSIANDMMQLNPYGKITAECWSAIPEHFRNVELDAFVIMPNHVHGILFLVVGARHAVPLQNDEYPQIRQFGNPVPASIPTIVCSFKSALTKRINALRYRTGESIWQRNYYEHIIRNEKSLNTIREYIATNPQRWQVDGENPLRRGTDNLNLWLKT